MTTELAIITACSRPENLSTMYTQIHASQTETFHITWLIVHDAEEVNRSNLRNDFWIEHYAYKSADSVAGKGQVNYALDLLKERGFNGWVYILDDDNILHPMFCRAIETLDTVTKHEAVAFAQQLDGWIRQAFPDTMKETHIDQAQYAMKMSVIGDERIPLRYTGDGAFAEALFKKTGEKWVFLTDVLCYYNALRSDYNLY